MSNDYQMIAERIDALLDDAAAGRCAEMEAANEIEELLKENCNFRGVTASWQANLYANRVLRLFYPEHSDFLNVAGIGKPGPAELGSEAAARSMLFGILNAIEHLDNDPLLSGIANRMIKGYFGRPDPDSVVFDDNFPHMLEQCDDFVSFEAP